MRIWRTAQGRTNKPVRFGTVSAQGIYHFLRIEAVLSGPLPPHARNGRSGINQNSVKVEQQTAIDHDDF